MRNRIDMYDEKRRSDRLDSSQVASLELQIETLEDEKQLHESNIVKLKEELLEAQAKCSRTERALHEAVGW